MKLPNWFKIAWWVVLSGSLIGVLWKRFAAIQAGNANSIDAFLLLILIILLLLPLFQEFDLFGVKLKAQIAEVKSEVKEQVAGLRQDILNIGINAQFSPQISPQFNLSPPSESSLPSLLENFKKILKDSLQGKPSQDLIDIQTEISVPHDVNYLFLVRYTIEKELRRIWRERFDGGDERRPVPVFRIVQALREADLLEPKLGGIIREVYSACSPAIHGEGVSEKQVAFIRDIAPELITALMEIQ
jgi:hypothetical protein